MRKLLLLFLLIASSICSVFAQSWADITPNTVEENQTIQVFISGSSQSLFEESTFGAPASLRLRDGNNLITIPNNYNIWQWNSSVGSDGFYTNIPALSVGTYALEIDNCWATGGCWSTLDANAFTVTAIPAQITSLTPSKVIQSPTVIYSDPLSQGLDVFISGVNTNFDNWSGGSIVFSQYSGTSFSGYLNAFYPNNLEGGISIPIDADTGLYDLTVSNSLATESYSLSNALTIYPRLTVDQTFLQQGTSGQLFVSVPPSTLQEFLDTAYVWFSMVGEVNFDYSSYSSYEWNGNLGSYGYYVDYSVPLSRPVGTYSLLISAGNQWVIESNMTITPSPPTIISISPSQGNPGQNLSVTISGINMDFGDQWSGISTFRLHSLVVGSQS